MTEPARPTIVFDLDGTLVSTARDLVAALNHALAQMDLPGLPLDRARDMIGMGAEALIVRGLEAEGVAVTPERRKVLLAHFLEHYEANMHVSSTPFPHVLEQTRELMAEGWRTAICTNKTERLARILIDRLALKEMFPTLLGGDSLPYKKPDGRHLLATIEAAGGRPDRAVMVGDSRPDVDAAKNANVPVIAVDFGYTDEPVEAMNPDVVLSEFGALAATARRLIAD